MGASSRLCMQAGSVTGAEKPTLERVGAPGAPSAGRSDILADLVPLAERAGVTLTHCPKDREHGRRAVVHHLPLSYSAPLARAERGRYTRFFISLTAMILCTPPVRNCSRTSSAGQRACATR